MTTETKRIFVFGSNEAGIHGAGSAREAYMKHGARYGVGAGHSGNSYAIPTKDKYLKILPLKEIESHVKDFLRAAAYNMNEEYEVVAIGCGLAGYKPSDIAPMFKGYSSNVNLPKVFVDILESKNDSNS